MELISGRTQHIFEGGMNGISDGLEMGVRDREEFMCQVSVTKRMVMRLTEAGDIWAGTDVEWRESKGSV